MVVGDVQVQQVPQGPWDAEVQVSEHVVAEVNVGNVGQMGPYPHRVYCVNSASAQVVLHLQLLLSSWVFINTQRELISTRNTQHKYNNKDLSHLR